MRIKFELVGPGEVWIDDVQLYDLLFPLWFYERSEPEKLEFVKLISAVDSALQNGRLSECVSLLEGYWPRFLNAYTPAAASIAQPTPPAGAVPDVSADKVDETPAVSERWWVPSFLKR
jgi:hypothetical protein